MKPSVKILACLVFIIALLAVSCGSPQSIESEPEVPENELIGVWKVVEVNITGSDAQTITDPQQPGILIFTIKYRSFMAINRDTPRPQLPENPTDAQLVEAYGPFMANVGTYEVNGNTITFNYLISKHPNSNPDNLMTNEYKIEGDNLFTTYVGTENQYTTKYVRLE